MKDIRRILLLIIAWAVSAPLIAQSFHRQRLDSLLDLLQKHDRFMGTVAVTHNGTLLYNRAIGFDDLEADIVSSTQTKYRIGSISKMFTACLVLKAMEQGKLNLSDPLKNWFPAVPNSGEITIRNLLNHHSGIFNFTNDSGYVNWCYRPRTRAEIVDFITRQKPDFKPGRKAEYSNSNFVLLSFILEDVYGKPYQTLLEERITRPLGLQQTYYGRAINPGAHEARSYRYDEKWVAEKETDMSVPSGAGAVVSTPADLNRFIESLFAGNIINPASLEMMTTFEDGFGLGMLEFPYEEKTCLGHGGAIDGFFSLVAHIPEDTLSVSVITNGSRFSLNDVGLCALNCFYGRTFDLPKFQTVLLDSARLDLFTGEYTSPQIPLKLTVFRQGNQLRVQGTGQPSFPLEPEGENAFRFDPAGIRIEFFPETRKLILKQGGANYTFSQSL